MKKLTELNMLEFRSLILSLSAELRKFMKDEELKHILKEYADAAKGKQTSMTNLDVVFSVIDNMLITNESATWNILAIFTQTTPEQVQRMNNLEVIQQVSDFLSIEAYKKLLLQALK